MKAMNADRHSRKSDLVFLLINRLVELEIEISGLEHMFVCRRRSRFNPQKFVVSKELSRAPPGTGEIA